MESVQFVNIYNIVQINDLNENINLWRRRYNQDAALCLQRMFY